MSRRETENYRVQKHERFNKQKEIKLFQALSTLAHSFPKT